MNNQDVIGFGKINDFLQQLLVGQLTRWHVRVIQEKQFHFSAGLGIIKLNHLFPCIDIRMPIMCFVQPVRQYFSTRQFYCAGIGWITRVGNQGCITLIQVGHAYVHDTLLASNKGQHFRIRVYIHLIPFLVPG